MKNQYSRSELLLDAAVYSGVILAVIVTLYPFIYILSASVSDMGALIRGEVWLLPKGGLHFDSYMTVFNTDGIWRSYYNTIWYTVVGTALNLIFTIMAAYPLSRKKFFARNFFMLMIVFTMFFSGGLIPSFILVYNLGLYDTRWAIVIPGLISTFNLIICRTYFQSAISDELLEAARIDGSSEFKILRRIVLPLSKPVVAVLAIFYGVSHWNSFFSALLYLQDQSLQPLQIYLRRILLVASPAEVSNEFEMVAGEQSRMAEAVLRFLQIKYVVIVVALLPILFAYPLLQKYFIKGMMIGSLKG